MNRKKRQTLLIIFSFIFIINFIDELEHAFKSGTWAPVVGQLLILGVFAFIAYRSKDSFNSYREEYKKRFEENTDSISVKDAAIFSLTWSKEIYERIPEDRKKLVKHSFVLIGAAFVFMLFEIGFSNVLTLVICAALILAGVNLLVWVVSTERSKRDILDIEMKTAREMQMSLMPKRDPQFDGFDIAGICLPALNVGGDLFDFVTPRHESTLLGIAVADVAGKGMDAAMTAVFTSGALVSEIQHECDPRRIMYNLNSTVCTRNNKQKFVSLIFALIDSNQKTITMVNAGQSKPHIFHKGKVSIIENTGSRFPLGIVHDAEYQETNVRLESGDVILFYTDGLSEAMNATNEPFGIERLQKIFRESATKNTNAKNILFAIRRNIFFFTGNAEQHDDITIVVVKVL